ncbi:hypothetical protein AWL63_23820 (plasmid) [Sphingomonas panacis]|uniref:TonB-dependent receptor n=1 Tax=Sphingomonas panacis TaxID=1560345 RepID=A0A1B3ZIE8_9SPHN|nr:TonB-dependent receptor [Sphingomonas panacis]AOH87194.1 hypothetical protein AWL63_23820 [Sphingomonas panacis]
MNTVKNVSKVAAVLLLATSSHSAIASTASPAEQAAAQTDQQSVQSTPEAPAPASPATNPDNTVADIVVTANKRVQRLSDVGLTVSVLGADELKQRQISSLEDIANAIPGLSYTNSANNTPVYTLRGVGFYDTSMGAYPAVTVYSDEAPLPFPVMSKHSAYDLERIEVLKGPQGTLFGSNATGGAINYIAGKPSDQPRGSATISYGRFNEVNAEAFYTGPISENLTFRVAGRFERADAWQISNSRPNDQNGRRLNAMGRGILRYNPNDGLDIQLNVNGWIDHSQPQATQYIALQVAGALIDPTLRASPFSPEVARAADWKQGLPFARNSQVQATLRVDKTLSDAVKLTSITNYVTYSQNQRTDQDGLPLSALDLDIDRGTAKSFTQELRFSNARNQPIRWVVGGNLEKSDVRQTAQVITPQSSSVYAIFLGTGYFINGARFTTNQDILNYAFFGNVEADVVSNVTIKGGVRYTDSKNDGYTCNQSITDLPTDAGAFFYTRLLGGAYGPYTAGKCFPINDQGRAINGVAAGAPGPYVDTLHEHNVSWRAGVDWKVDPGVLLYMNVSKGYKAGSFPLVSSSSFRSYLPVKQESVLAIEGGIKATMFNRLLQINAAGFYYDYKNKQLRSKVADANFGILDVLQNIPKSSVRGVDADATLNFGGGLSLSGAVTYLDATIDEFSGINGAGLAGDFAGTAVPFSPKWQFAISPRITRPISDGVKLTAGLQFNYRTKAVTVVGGESNPAVAIPAGRSLSQIDAYGVLDGDIGLSLMDNKLNIAIYGKNLTNKYYWTNVVTTTNTVNRYAAMPITYGVRLGYNF